MKRIRVRVRVNVSAFTLIELTIVISIIMTMIALAAPSLKSFAESNRIKSSVSSLKSLLLYTRDLSITEKSAHLVVFDLENNQYWLTKPELIQNGDLESSIVTTTTATTATSDSNNTRSSQNPLLLPRSSMVLGLAKTPAKSVSLVQTSTTRNPQNRDGIDYVFFEPTGQAEEAIIYLQNRAGTFAVTIEAATGKASVHQIQEEVAAELGMGISK